MWREMRHAGTAPQDSDALLNTGGERGAGNLGMVLRQRSSYFLIPVVGLCVALAVALAVLTPSLLVVPGRDRGDPLRQQKQLPQLEAGSKQRLTEKAFEESAQPVDTTPAQQAFSVDGEVQIWQSARDMGVWERQADISFSEAFEFSGPVVSIFDEPQQTIVGFGGAFTEASALTWSKLPPQQKQAFIQDYFGPAGLGYTLGRVHINSCDFSVDHYSFDEVEGDFGLEHFDQNASHDARALIPLILAAQDSLQPQGKSLRLLASPWSPPAWMKTNGAQDHSGRPCLNDGMQPVWANYIGMWIGAYKAKGIPIWAVTVQNEPENDARWEACLLTPEEEAAFIGTHLGPALQKAHPDVLIFGFDHNKDNIMKWANALYADASSANYTAGIAFHWYSGDSFDFVEQVRAAYPKKHLLASEATYERYRWNEGTTLEVGDWSFGEGYAHDILGDLNAGSVGWIDWNLLLDQDGGPNHSENPCDAAIMADVTKAELYHHPQYYFMGHFSKFVLPGSLHLRSEVRPERGFQGPIRDYGICTGEDGLQATAARRPEGKIAVIVLNCGDDAIAFQVRYGDRAFATKIPPHAIQTYLLAGL